MKTASVIFRSRAFTSLIVALGFVALLVSGAVLFLSPPDRVANWTQWQIFGLTLHGWSDLHNGYDRPYALLEIIRQK